MASNTEKALINSTISFLAQIAAFALTFINRKVFLMFLSIEYLGYQSLFGNVFTLLSVAELGIGNVITYNLYREIANSNELEIGRLMHVYKSMYRIVAFSVLTIGTVCYFLLPFIVKETTLSWSYVSLIYFLQLFGVFAGYFLSYRRVIYIASQQEYKCMTIDLSVNVGIQILQLCFLALFKNYLVYLIINLSTSIIQNTIVYFKTRKDFPFLSKKYQVSRDYLKSRNFFQDIRNILIHRISYAVYDGTDNVVISSFIGVASVGVYGNYYTIYSHIVRLMVSKILGPIQATLGNILHSGRDLNQLWEQFETFDVFSFFFASQISMGFFVFFQPFIQLWFGEEYLLPFSFVILFVITIYFGLVWEMVYKYRSVLGDFKQDSVFMILSAVLNITVSVLCVKKWGVAGIQFGTLVALFPMCIGRIRFVVKNYFHQSMVKYLLKHISLFCVFTVECVACYFLTKEMLVNIPFFLLRGVVWLVVPLTVNCLLFCRNRHFKELLKYVSRIKRIVMDRLYRKKSGKMI